jgi:hypothetical protein
MVQVI